MTRSLFLALHLSFSSCSTLHRQTDIQTHTTVHLDCACAPRYKNTERSSSSTSNWKQDSHSSNCFSTHSSLTFSNSTSQHCSISAYREKKTFNTHHMYLMTVWIIVNNHDPAEKELPKLPVSQIRRNLHYQVLALTGHQLKRR